MIIRQLPHIEGLGEVARGWIKNGTALKKALTEALVPLAEVSNTLLGFVLEVVVLATTKQFLASDHFIHNNKDGVKIAYIWEDFKENFLSKVEDPQGEIVLHISKLNKNSPDKPILDELGDKAETTLASIWELLKKQPNGKPGKFLTNGYANIFYVRDAKGVLWAVGVRWRGGGWRVDAYSVTSPVEWGGGDQVFSRNS